MGPLQVNSSSTVPYENGQAHWPEVNLGRLRSDSTWNISSGREASGCLPGLIARGLSSFALQLGVRMELAILDGCDIISEPRCTLLVCCHCIFLDVKLLVLDAQAHE